MSLFIKRALLTLTLLLLLSVAYLALAADVTINANIPSGGININIPPVVYGCTDPAATNYSPSATVDNGTCVYSVSGCTDSTAINYNPSATIDDGSCVYDVLGCTDPEAINYNPSATIDDGSCQAAVLGCTDSEATNYNSQANQDDGSCQYIVSGCTDPTATNYNSNATIDDGSCAYQVSGCTNPLADNYDPLATVDDGTCIVFGCTNPLADNYDPLSTQDNGSCIILGCTDPTAVNYNPQATVDNGTCSYNPDDIPGCTDASALNYNPQATVDNGTCSYPVFGCTDSTALNYNPSATVNNDTCVYRLPFVNVGSGLEPDYNFFTDNNSIQLFLQDNNIDLLANYELLVLVADNFTKEVDRITATVGGENLLFKYDLISRQYLLQLNKFDSPGQTNVGFFILYQDGSSHQQNITVTVHPLGRVFSKIPEDKTRLFGISVLLYDEDNNLIRQLSKINPDGTYGFMVRNGRYKLVVFDNGEKIYDGRLFNVNNNIINRDIGLTLLEQIIKAVEEVLDNPIIEETNKYVAPVAVSAVAVSTFVAVPWWSFVSYFQSLFTEPLAWLFRRRRKGWGVVYNSITKKPIDLAIVRLYDKTSGKLLKSKVTDKDGRYNFLVSEGSYILEVVKPSMVFPSVILKEIVEDKQFTNIYHGEQIDILKDQKGIITANIPVDPQDVKMSDKEIIRKNFWYKVQKNISLIGPVFALISFAIMPTVLIGSLAIVHILLYFLFRRLALKGKVNKWGVILDAKTGKPVAGTVAKIYSPEYDKMLEAQVTDRHGRYGFLAGNNIYYIGASKDGYMEAKTGNIDLTHKKSEEVVGRDIELHSISDQADISDVSGKSSQDNPEIKSEIESISEEPQDDIINHEEDSKTKTPVDNNQPPEEKEASALEEMADKLKQEAENQTSPVLENKDGITNQNQDKSIEKEATQDKPEIAESDLSIKNPDQLGDNKDNSALGQANSNLIGKPNQESKFG